jgi:hypothetical protein
MLSLSKALEEGTPVAPHLQQLAASCPDDPLVEAVAASLPASAVSQGLPTLQVRWYRKLILQVQHT